MKGHAGRRKGDEDPLAPFRAVMAGAVVGVLVWALVAVVALLAWRWLS